MHPRRIPFILPALCSLAPTATPASEGGDFYKVAAVDQSGNAGRAALVRAEPNPER